MSSLFQISEKQHLGALFLSKLAALPEGENLRVSQAAKAFGASESYLEEIVSALKQAGLVKAKTGPTGGYQLAKLPSEITAHEMVTSLEGPIALVPCLSHQKGLCGMEAGCKSKSLWNSLQTNINSTLKSTTLADLIN